MDAAKDLADYLSSHACQGFHPGVRYQESGDLLIAWWSDDLASAEQVTPELTIYRSIRTGEVVGVKVVSVHAVIRDTNTSPETGCSDM